MEDEIREESNTHWLDDELAEIQTPTPNFEKLPSPRMEENKITKMIVILEKGKKFGEWTDDLNKKVKTIIPIIQVENGKEVRKNFWLNKKNPLYREILQLAKEKDMPERLAIGVLQIGKGPATQYKLVKD